MLNQGPHKRHVFQFTHPGGVRPPLGDTTGCVDKVSIHAPGRGATQTTTVFQYLSTVSIHAPGRGATLSVCFKYSAP